MVSAGGGTPYTSMGLEVQGVDRKATKVLVTAQQPREMVTAQSQKCGMRGYVQKGFFFSWTPAGIWALREEIICYERAFQV